MSHQLDFGSNGFTITPRKGHNFSEVLAVLSEYGFVCTDIKENGTIDCSDITAAEILKLGDQYEDFCKKMNSLATINLPA